jgi:hypothetical protein
VVQPIRPEKHRYEKEHGRPWRSGIADRSEGNDGRRQVDEEAEVGPLLHAGGHHGQQDGDGTDHLRVREELDEVQRIVQMLVQHGHGFGHQRDAANGLEDHEGAEERGDDPVGDVEAFHVIQ